jgi:hypothetical protein
LNKSFFTFALHEVVGKIWPQEFDEAGETECPQDHSVFTREGEEGRHCLA